MKDYLNTIRLQSKTPISEEGKKGILQKLTLLTGIEGTQVGNDFVEIEYYPQFQSVDTLKQALTLISFDFQKTTPNSDRGHLKNWIFNLAKENRKTFGSKRPSCCG